MPRFKKITDKEKKEHQRELVQKALKELEAKKKNGRPTKLTKKFIDVANEVITYNINAIIHTDEDLLFLINDKLSKKERIDDRTFQRWKAKAREGNEEELDKNGKTFVVLIKRNLILQKDRLFSDLQDDPKGWQRFAWILERKFDDWNIKVKTDITSGGQQIVGFNYLPPKTGEQKTDE